MSKFSEREKATGHAVMSPSQLYRILLCPGSVNESLKAPIQPSSTYAQDGTDQHALVTAAWASGNPEHYIHGLNIDDAWKSNVLDCTDYLGVVLKSCSHGSGGVTLRLERRVDLSDWELPEIWGTTDVEIIDTVNHVAHIIDWKFGSGVQVFAQNNEQGMCYAAGSLGYPSLVDEVHIHIIQPPLNHFDEWVIDYDDLINWVEGVLKPGIQAARNLDASYNPGKKQCRFCPAAMTCRARYDKQLVNAEEVFKVFAGLPNVTIRRAVAAYKKGLEVAQYTKELANFIQAEYLRGRKTPGMKCVSGRSTRKWANPDEVEWWLMNNSEVPEDKMFTKKLISPAQAEKIDRQLKKDGEFQRLIVKPPGKPQLVEESDPRQALDPSGEATKAFEGFIGE